MYIIKSDIHTKQTKDQTNGWTLLLLLKLVLTKAHTSTPILRLSLCRTTLLTPAITIQIEA